MFFFRLGAQQPGAHHRGQGERNDGRNRHRHGQGNREFAEQPAHDMRRNRKMTSTTSTTVSSKVNCTSWTEARMVSVRSFRMDTFTVGGSAVRSLVSSPFTRSAVWMMFAPGCR